MTEVLRAIAEVSTGFVEEGLRHLGVEDCPEEHWTEAWGLMVNNMPPELERCPWPIYDRAVALLEKRGL